MNYIWNNYAEHNKYVVNDEMLSPYAEYIPNYNYGENGIQYINPLLRFDDIFDPLLSLLDNDIEHGAGISNEIIESIENIIFHYLAQLDRKTGIHKFSIIEHIIEEELENGLYGKFVAECYKKLLPTEKIIVKKFLKLYNQSNGQKIYFNEIIQNIFPGSSCYFHEEDNNMVLFLPQTENFKNVYNLKNSEKLTCIEYLFLDVTTNLRVFWQHHFGIIGRNETMKIGNIAIY